MNDWLRVTAIGGDDYECRMTVLKADDTTITITRPWHHHWTDGWDWKTIIRQWLMDEPETFEPYDGLAEWLRDAGTYRCTVSDGRDDSALKDVTLIVTADNKVGLYDNQGKEMK